MEKETQIGLTKPQREAVIEILKKLLADEYLLYTKTRNFHWNIVGAQFHDYHKFFETQYEQLAEIVDGVAERIRSLGGVSPGSMAELLAATRLSESPGALVGGPAAIASLLNDHETVIRQLRADLAAAADQHGDAGTSDFLTGLMEEHEKMAWMLRAHLASA